MSLLRPNANDVAWTSNCSPSVVSQSGLCARCIDGCQGNCEVFQASFRGRELLRSGPSGGVPSGGERHLPVDYSHLNIQGWAMGDEDSPGRSDAASEAGILSVVNVQAEYGWDKKVKMAAPVLTGGLGAAEIARRNWEHVAAGAAISGITLVCGQDICGSDPGLKLDARGCVVSSAEMDRRIETYLRYHRGLGEILVQTGVCDARLGVAEYVLEKHGLDSIELTWGRAGQCLADESCTDSLTRALEWQQRGHLVTPDPSDPLVQEAQHDGSIRHFQRHSRLGFTEQDAFLDECDRLRRLGFQRITLHARACGLPELAMALKWASLAKIDLLTIDGASAAAEMKPWRMRDEWGMPGLYLHSAAVRFADRLARKGLRVPDLALTGGFSAEGHLFKALALGAPYVKAVCMGRALMIPGMVGKNVRLWMQNGGLPKTVSQYGETLEEIFVCWGQVAEIVGNKEMQKIPLGAVGVYSYVQKLTAGLQHLMAGAGSFSLSALRRTDLVSLTRECAEVTGVPYVMDAARDEAEAILDG